MELHARKTDAETSQEALNGIATLTNIVLSELEAFGVRGATTVELAAVLDKNRDSISPLLPQLERKGLVKRTGYKRRVGKSKQIIWVIKSSGFIPLAKDEVCEVRTAKATKDDVKQLLEDLRHLAFMHDAELFNRINDVLERY